MSLMLASFQEMDYRKFILMRTQSDISSMISVQACGSFISHGTLSQ